MADMRQLEDFERRRSDDSFILDEWMIIDDTLADKENEMSRSLACCSIKDNYVNLGNIRNDNGATHENDAAAKDEADDAVERLDDSDDVSVITESDNEQVINAKEIRRIEEINETSGKRIGSLKVHQADDKTVSQVGTIFNVIVACSLAAVIGLGAGRILGIDECAITNDVDFASVKMKNEFLINQLKELNGVKDVLDEIKASIPKANAGNRKHFESHSDAVTNGKVNSQILDFSLNKDRKMIINDDSKIVERLKDSLENLCSIIDDIAFDKTRLFAVQLCDNQRVIEDLLIFENVISDVLRDSTYKTMEMRILENAEEKINNVCRSLLFDLSNSVDGIATKIYRKLERVSTQINEKLCTLRKDDGSEFLKKLPSDNNFFANCVRMSNVTRKSEKSATVNEAVRKTLKSTDKSGCNKRLKIWKNKDKSKSRKARVEFLKKEIYYSPEEDTCCSVQMPWLKLESKKDFEFDKGLDAQENSTSATGANAKNLNLQESKRRSKGFNTARAKNAKNMWNKRIRDSKIAKKEIEGRRDSQKCASRDNLESRAKDTYASKVKSSRNKINRRKEESSYELNSKREARSNGKECLNEKRVKTADNKDPMMVLKCSKRNSKRKLAKRQGLLKMHENREEKLKKDMQDGEWQFQRSKGRAILRDREKSSDWYFDRAESRKYSREYENQPEVEDGKKDDENLDLFLFQMNNLGGFGMWEPKHQFRSD